MTFQCVSTEIDNNAPDKATAVELPHEAVRYPLRAPIMDTMSFLDLVHGSGASIYWNVGLKTWHSRAQPFTEVASKLQMRNARGDGIAFIVNKGGTRLTEITAITAVFGDWDTGRDTDRRYFPVEVVDKQKVRFLERLDQLPLAPSLLVETRNGFHPYWLLNAGATIQEFRACQEQIISVLGGDPAVKNANRVMRLPGYNWTKAGYEPFAVSVVQHQDVRYDIRELSAALPSVQATVERPRGRISTPNKNRSTRKHHSNDSCVIGGIKPPSAGITVLGSYREATEWLKHQDLAAWLGTSEGVTPCPFHHDGSPSASIFVGADGHRIFHCHAPECGVTGTIIDLQMRQAGIDARTAIRQLLEEFGATVDREQIRSSLTALLDYNLAQIQDRERLKAQFPNLYRWIGRAIPDFTSKLLVARKHLIAAGVEQERVTFFASLRYFEARRKGHAETTTRSKNQQGCRVDRYCLLGLMQKLQDEQIPARYLKRATTIQKTSKYRQRTQFYAIPRYTCELLAQAEEIATKLTRSGATSKGISRQLILDIFGDDVAEQVYPQIMASVQSVGSLKFHDQLEAALLQQIAERGFALVASLEEEMVKRYDWGTVTAKRVRRHLPGLLVKHNLHNKHATACDKERFGIGGQGYPKIITRAA